MTAKHHKRVTLAPQPFADQRSDKTRPAANEYFHRIPLSSLKLNDTRIRAQSVMVHFIHVINVNSSSADQTFGGQPQIESAIGHRAKPFAMTRTDKQDALGSENFGRSDQQHDNGRERNGSGRKTSWSLGSTIFFSIFFLVIGYGI